MMVLFSVSLRPLWQLHVDAAGERLAEDFTECLSLPHLDFRCQKLFKRSVGERNCCACRGKLSLTVPTKIGN